MKTKNLLNHNEVLGFPMTSVCRAVVPFSGSNSYGMCKSKQSMYVWLCYYTHIHTCIVDLLINDK